MFIKFCGFTRHEDVEAVSEMRSVSAVGYIFHEKSARYIDPSAAGKLSQIIDRHNRNVPGKILKVGIFVEHAPGETLKIASEAGLDVLQVYNREVVEELTRSYPVFFAARVKDRSVLENMPRLSGESRYLLDAYNENSAGGTGESFDWSMVDGFHEINRTIIAGGICIDNVRQVLAIPGIYGIDLSSGIEDSPGVKSYEKMKQLDSAIMEVLNGKQS